MFKPHYGQCSHQDHQGHDDSFIVVKKGWCDRCNHSEKQKKKKSSGNTGYKYARKATGEKDVFHHVLDSFDDKEQVTCFVCGKRLSLLSHHNFAHIVPKKKCEEARLDPDNIKIMCYNFDGTGCHSKYDFWPKSELGKEFDKVFELREQLEKKYKLRN